MSDTTRIPTRASVRKSRVSKEGPDHTASVNVAEVSGLLTALWAGLLAGPSQDQGYTAVEPIGERDTRSCLSCMLPN
jgi:hypothetical protein